MTHLRRGGSSSRKAEQARENPSSDGAPGWRHEVGQAKAKGKRTDTEDLRASPLHPGLMGQQIWMPPTERLILSAGVLPTPPSQGTAEISPRACRSHPSSEAQASLGFWGEPVSRQDESPGLFYHSRQEHNPPPLTSRAGAGSRDYPPTHEALTVTGIGLVPVLQDGSI